MRYALFLVIVLLSVYFLFFKPFLSARGIDYEVRLSTLSFQPLYLELDSLYVYIPFKNLEIFLRLSRLTVEFEKKLKLKLKEGNVNLIVKETRKKARRSLKILLPKWLRELDIELDRFLVNYGRGNRQVSILVEDARMVSGKLFAKAQLITPRLTTHIVVKEALLKEESIELTDVLVESDLFTFSLNATANETDQKAFFKLHGKINKIETKNFSVEPVSIRGRGELDYKGIRIFWEGNTKGVEVVGRRSYRNIEAEGTLVLKFRNSLHIEGKLQGDEVAGRYYIRLLPDRLVIFKAHRFVVDSELLGIKRRVELSASGEVVLKPDEKSIKVYAEGKEPELEGIKFSRGELKLTYNYDSGKGEVDLKLLGPGKVNLLGSIEGKVFRGKVLMEDVLLSRENLSASVTYRGTLVYKGGLKLSGGGFLKDIKLSTFALDTLFFRAFLENKYINVNFYGRGLRGFVRGAVGGKLIAETQMQGFTLELVGGGNLNVTNGHIKLHSSGSKLYADMHIYAGSFSHRMISLPFEGRAWFTKDKESLGSFEISSSSVKLLGGPELKGLRIKGKVKGKILEGEYAFEKKLRGSFRYSFSSGRLESEGGAKLGLLEVSYAFTGSRKKGKFVAKLLSEKLSGKKPASLKVSYEEKFVEAFLNGGAYKYGAMELELGKVLYRGRTDKGELYIGKSVLKVLGKPLLEVSQKEANYRDGKFNLELKLEGAVKGGLEFTYRAGVYKLESEGTIDLDRLSFFTATPVGGKLKGILNYNLVIDKKGLELSVKNRDNVVAYSRFLSTPVNLWVELRAFGKDLSAFLNLWKGNSVATVNVGSIDLKNYYLYITSSDLPISYRSKKLRTNLNVSSRGWIDVKNLRSLNIKAELSFSGDVEILGLPGSPEDGGRTFKDTELDIEFSSSDPIRVYLPEGYLYSKLRGWIRGKGNKPDYYVELDLLSGELNYFGRSFFVREGKIKMSREKGKEDKELDVLLVNSSPAMSIFISLKGDMDEPDVVVWSEPPMDTRQLLTKLVVGSTAEGIIPVAKALFKELGYTATIKDSLTKFLGLEISLLTKTGNRGELGINVSIKKKIAKLFTVEYQQSTLNDPRETYYGGSISLPTNTSIYGRVFSDKSAEIKLRFIRKFNF